MKATARLLPAVIVAVWLAGSAMAAESPAFAGITRPSELRHLAFVRPGIVAEVPVKEGDAVKAGDLLIRQDDAAEQLQLNMLAILAADTTRLEFAQAELEKVKLELKMVQDAYDKEVATSLELLQAKSELRLKTASLTLTKLDQQKAQADHEEMTVRVAQMRILSPIAGTVEVIQKKAGEAADGQEEVIAVVSTDPLWVDARVKLATARGLKAGRAANVRFHEPTGSAAGDKARLLNTVVPGKIIFTSAMAEGGELRVRVEIPNPDVRPAGEHVQVTFPQVDRSELSASVGGKAVAAAQNVPNRQDR